FNLGFGNVIQQLASHQRAFLYETPAGILTGDAAKHARLAAILRLTVRWSVGLFVAWCLVMVPFGLAYFGLVRGLAGIDWRAGWVMTAVITGCYLFANGLTKFLSGCADVTAVARVLMLQLVVASAVFCVALAAGARMLGFPLCLLCGL